MSERELLHDLKKAGFDLVRRAPIGDSYGLHMEWEVEGSGHAVSAMPSTREVSIFEATDEPFSPSVARQFAAVLLHAADVAERGA